jgi:iron complex outermembrane receptor protein
MLVSAVAVSMPVISVAQEDESIEEIVTTGTRGQPRSAADSPVAIDSFNEFQLDQQPSGDMTETLKGIVPSFTATPLTGDGSSFIRSTSLRGLPPDEVLLLVNGKRRHRSALIQLFGAAMSAGSHASDMGPLPSIALKRVEVLRDGASSQYGSDAIAGVINFILRDNDEGAQIEAQYGEFFEGESSIKVAGNFGMRLGEGFLNISAEWTDDEQLIRGFQPAAAQAAIDAGIPLVGEDSPYPGDTLAQTWGRPEARGVRTAWNMAVPLENSEIYMFGNFADLYGNYRFFYRAPDHPSLQPLPLDPTDPSQGNFCWCDVLPGGYTPYLVGDQIDFANSLGLRGEFDGGMLYDLSLTYGRNRIAYTLYNTLSPNWGPQSRRDFRPGDLEEEDINFNADFSMPLRDNIHLGFGFEYREEEYVMYLGDEQSWDPGPWQGVGQLIDPVTGTNYAEPPSGSNGLSGTPPRASGKWDRANYAVYGDLEWDVMDIWLLQFALRYEDFEDFGTTTNAKIATRFNITDILALRGAISTGFRAPTVGQQNLETIVTTFDTGSGLQVQEGTLKPTDPLLVPLGGKALEPEEALNLSLGFSLEPTDNLSITFDYYWIEVTDRIAKTFDIDVSGDPDFQAAGFESVAFYTNALETETQGIDIVANWDLEYGGGSSGLISFAYNWNDTEVTGQNQVNGVNPVGDGIVFNIENNLPDNRMFLAYNHFFDSLTLTARLNWYDEASDERGFPDVETVDADYTVDVEARWMVNDTWTWTIGANNVFDTFPNEVQSRQSNGLPYSRRTPFGYDGGMWYVKGTVNF